MNPRTIRLIIVFSTISLIAALITQLLWVKDAMQLKGDRFASKVELSMNTVVNQLLTSESYRHGIVTEDTVEFIANNSIIFTLIDPAMLDSFMMAEFGSETDDDSLVYGVYMQETGVFVMGRYHNYEELLLKSAYQVSLSCLCEEEIFMLSVVFPERKTKFLSELILLPVMSGLFLLVLVFSFFFTIFSLLRQKKLSEMKTDFINNMTHEFKTPISTILVSSEILMQDKIASFPDKVKKYARVVFDENERLKNLVDRVLLIASMEKEEFKPRLELFDAKKVIHESLDNFGIQFSEKKVKLETDFKAVKYDIMADKLHFYHIINNLLDNACKYSPDDPEIVLRTKNDDSFLVIDVQDNGIGIGKESLKRVFKKFHRLQQGDIHNVKGFGIGLYYVKSILKIMGGSISVKSELNKGSTFTVIIPLQK